MGKTVKWEHPTDSWHIGHRIERKARPAGRIEAIVAAELALYEDGPQRITRRRPDNEPEPEVMTRPFLSRPRPHPRRLRGAA